MAYVGNSPSQQTFTGGMDQFSGNASNTTFGLSRSVNTAYDVDVYVESVFQRPGVAYTVSANTITFTSAPSAGSNNVVVVYNSYNTTSIVPVEGSVSTRHLGTVTNINAGTNADLALQANNNTALTVSSNLHVTTAGSMLVGGTDTTKNIQLLYAGGGGAYQTINHPTSAGDGYSYLIFGYNGSRIAEISQAGTGSVTYNTAGAHGSRTGTNLIQAGIQFPSTQVPSSDANTLDDYEEGTFTPFDSTTVSARGITIPCQAFYVKIGRMCHVWFRFSFSNTSSATQISGSLPFAGATPTSDGGSTSPFFISVFPQSGSPSHMGFAYNGGTGDASFSFYQNNAGYPALQWNSGCTQYTVIGAYRTSA